MKVGLLHYSVPPVVGGVESVIGHHARLLAGAGHEVCMIAARGEPTDPRIRLIRIPELDSRHPDVLSLKAELDSGEVPPGFDALITRITDTLGPHLAPLDTLIAHNVCSLNKNLALTAALHNLAEMPRAPHLILWHHDLAWSTPRYLPELYAGWPWDLLRDKWPGSTHVVISSLRRSELADLTDLAPATIHIVPNGLEIPAFLKLEEQTRALLDQTGLLAAAPILLLPVRITTRKNIELAIETLARLRSGAFPDAALVVTGPLGPHNPANAAYFQRLRDLRATQRLEGAAWFLAELAEGYLPDAVIADFYGIADALFFPSREEGFGIPVLEAGIAGLPVFCSDIPPLRDLGGEMVVYFSPDSPPDAVASKIEERLINDPTYQLKVHVRQAYRWESIYRDHIAPLLERMP